MKRFFTLVAAVAVALAANAQTQLKTGDHFEYNGNGYTVVGENLIENPDFDNGTTGWTGGAGGSITNVTINGTGGVNNGSYIVPTGSKGKGENDSPGTSWPIEKGKTYLFSFYMKNMSNTGAESPAGDGYIKVSLSNSTSLNEDEVLQPLPHVDADLAWTQNNYIFTTDKWTYLAFSARWLGGAKGFDAFILAEVEQDADPTELINLCEECTEWLDYYDEPDEEAYDIFETLIAEAFAMAEEGGEEHTATEFNAMIATLTDALLDFRMACADDENIVDVTSRYITNGQFSNSYTGWQSTLQAVNGGTNIRNFAYFEETLNPVMEVNGSPSQDIVLTQTINGLPKGYYIFSVDCVMNHSADVEDPNAETGAWIFCNGAEQILKPKEITTDGAANADSHPERFEIRGVVADTSIVIGLKVAAGSNCTYVAIDNVKLEYAGFNVGVYLQALVEEVQDYLNDNESTLLPKIYDDLADLSMEAESYLGDEDDVMNEWYDKLYDGFKKAKDSFTKLAELGDITNSFLELLESTEYEGLEVAQAVYEEAQNLVDGNDDEATYETIVAMIAKVQQAIIDYQKSQTATHDNPANYSFFIVNPQCYTNTTGWTGTAAGFEYNVAEFYNKDWDLYQTLTDLPNGLYEVSLYGFFRTGANDGGEAYRNGGENLIAKLYANDMNTSIMSLYTFTEEECGVSGTGTNGYINVRQYADEAFTAGFYSENKVKVIVTDGTLTIGVRGTGHEDSSWFAFRDFGLKYFGPATDEDYKEIWEKVAVECDAIVEGLLAGDKAGYNALYDAAKAQVAEGKYTEAYTNMITVNEEYAGIAATTKNFINGTYANLATAGETMGSDGAAIVEAAYGFAKAAIEAADAKSDIIANLEKNASAYSSYAAYVEEVAALVANANKNKYVKEYVDVVKEIMASNKSILTAEFHTAADVNDVQARLANAVAAMKKSSLLSVAAGSDVTEYIIQNPNIDGSNNNSADGWIFVKGNADKVSNTGQHYTGDTGNRYLDSWNATAGALTVTTYQVLSDIPNGTYCLDFVGRGNGENDFFFASVAPYEEINDSTMRIAVLDPATKFLALPNTSDTCGPIWQARYDMWEAGTLEEGTADYDIFSAHDGNGYGWAECKIDDIVVENHTMTIGVTTDSTLTMKAFTGNWFSCDEFKLTLKSLGDNSSYTIDTNVRTIDAVVLTREFIALDGKKYALPQKGINIVREILSDGTIIVRKELVR